MLSRTTQSLLAAVGVLALAVGIAEVHPPTGQAAVTGATVLTAVQHSTLICPPPVQGSSGSTGYGLAVPGLLPGTTAGSASGSSSGAAAGGDGAVLGSLTPGGTGSKALAKQTAVGGSTTAKAAGGDKAPALLAESDGSTAPGFTVQQTTSGVGSTLSGTGCTAPGTEFWFAGADTAKGSADYLELSNAEATAADVDIQIFGPNGEVDNTQAASINVPAGGTASLLLSTLIGPGNDNSSLAVHVQVRSGRVAAALHADSGSKGADWIPATTAAGTQVIAGLPGDLSDAVLVVAAPGSADADLNVQLASQSGWITPAGHETVHVKAGMVTAVDLSDITRGQPAALRLTPTDAKQAAPVVAGIQVVRGGKSGTDTGYLSGSGPIGQRATAAGSTGSDTTLLLTDAGSKAAVVQVATIGSGSTPVSTSVSVPAGATVAVTPKAPGGGSYAVTLTSDSGGSVYAARMITRASGSVPAFTVQQLTDDRSTVQIPHALQDNSILTR
ncbi:DUF5719 family protein [Streptacidiphilus carbonis]|jgi:hypothetical protein|uniref:DUF5719 family protein n=1 Tax=Streptacidiphilus carbonis TaxID=105422 RepID=UPI0005A702EE|nr:DUF5719 family protein [Streptacidiphilus carbonis]